MTETGVFYHLPGQRKQFRAYCQQRRNEFAQLRRRLIHAHLVQCQRFFRFSFAIVATIDRRKFTNTFHSTWIRLFHRYALFDVLVFRSFLWHFRFVFQHLSLPLAGRPFGSRCYARHLFIVQCRRQLDGARWRRRRWRTAQCAANIRRYTADGAEIRAHACRAGYRWWAVGGNCMVRTPWLCYGLRTEFDTWWVCEWRWRLIKCTWRLTISTVSRSPMLVDNGVWNAAGLLTHSASAFWNRRTCNGFVAIPTNAIISRNSSSPASHSCCTSSPPSFPGS